MVKQTTPQSLASLIDHTVLDPAASAADLRSACELGARFGVASVCVRPCDVAAAVSLLGGTQVGVCAVVGFPHGTNLAATKSAEAAASIDQGATELDLVVNASHLHSGLMDLVTDEIASVVQAADGRWVKTVIECAYLNRAEMSAACHAAIDAGANFVAAATGFGPSGAAVEDVEFLRSQVGDRLGVKASGDIATLGDALAMISAGANRIGTRATAAILDEADGSAGTGHQHRRRP